MLNLEQKRAQPVRTIQPLLVPGHRKTTSATVNVRREHTPLLQAVVLVPTIHTMTRMILWGRRQIAQSVQTVQPRMEVPTSSVTVNVQWEHTPPVQAVVLVPQIHIIT